MTMIFAATEKGADKKMGEYISKKSLLKDIAEYKKDMRSQRYDFMADYARRCMLSAISVVETIIATQPTMTIEKENKNNENKS